MRIHTIKETVTISISQNAEQWLPNAVFSTEPQNLGTISAVKQEVLKR